MSNQVPTTMLDRLQSLFAGEAADHESTPPISNTTPIDDEMIRAVAADHPEFSSDDLTQILNAVQEYCELAFQDDTDDHPIADLLRTQYDRDAIEHTVTTKQSMFASIIKGERWQTTAAACDLSAAELQVA